MNVSWGKENDSYQSSSGNTLSLYGLLINVNYTELNVGLSRLISAVISMN